MRGYDNVRAAWFSTVSTVKRPREPALAAEISAVAEGRQEFGHMYFRMKSCGLQGSCERFGAEIAGFRLLIHAITAFGERRSTDHHGGICWLESVVH